MNLAETLNRTMKLAMDEGRVQSYQEAIELFRSFRIRLKVEPGFSAIAGVEAAVLTLLRAGPKTFLGGIELVGPLDEQCTLAWFAGKSLGEVAADFGVCLGRDVDAQLPTICVGAGCSTTEDFWLGLTVEDDGFVLTPDVSPASPKEGSVAAGVAGAGAALNQAFQHIYRRSPQAGQREVRFQLPKSDHSAPRGDLWVIGLGHLGQAFLWTTLLKGRETLPNIIRLTDDDKVSVSSLSTCLLVDTADVGRRKVNAVAKRLAALGVKVARDPKRLDLDSGAITSAQSLCVIAVDNLALRKSLDKVHGAVVLEAGIGDGTEGFTRVQAHAFPGPRLARDVWLGEDIKASQRIDISRPAYRSLLAESGDECGTTLVAGRSIATPFVGAFAGALLARLATSSAFEQHGWNYDVNSL